ncbi:MAG: UDP-N-acetylmuramoyl-L-alanyl-D-glutamate--2,6-diaminopimelate ligase [Elusimicrobia bacterium]|nr:UDP-N-acetylmuramoyl-L-alanyl-D-glutamate--2,6-diaminopimelate ligase [Elusimicrobiota bacterium]
MTRKTLSGLVKKFGRHLQPLFPNNGKIFISGVTCDSRRVKPGVIFCALSGQKTHGLRFGQEVIRRGARVLLIERPYSKEDFKKIGPRLKKAAVFAVSRLRPWLGELANWIYDNPSQKLRVAAITATSGKTTTCYLMEAIARAAGQKVGVLGTISYRIGGKSRGASLTTPQPDEAISLMAEMVKARCRFCFMEATSQALDMGRLDDLQINGAIFGNLSRDHLDYHKTMPKYFEAKTTLFERILAQSSKKELFAVINHHDPWGKKLVGRLKKHPKIRRVTFGISPEPSCEVWASDIRLGLRGTDFDLHIKNKSYVVRLHLIGGHNVYNALAAAGACYAMGFSVQAIVRGLENLRSIPGRLEQIWQAKDFTLLVDYAHKPDALDNVLKTLRRIPEVRRVIVVVGCGGDRDRGKRPIMGEIAARLAGIAVFTSDNPRSENPEAILDQIEAGAKKAGLVNYKRLADRAEAIGWAIKEARPGDAVLIAGKGHETYQIFRDRTIHFDDREVCRGILAKL